MNNPGANNNSFNLSFDSESQEGGPMLIVFNAEWSSTSTITEVVSKKVQQERKDLKVLVLDVENSTDLKFKYKVKTIPTCIFVSENELKFKLEGMFSKRKILARINESSDNNSQP